jgi:2-polyprenyl-3-methyl-5-hydroxy-6-metoxy-1,4-benzoquinol methylase
MDRAYWDNITKSYDTEIFDVLKNDKKGIILSWINSIASKEHTIADIGCGIGKWLPTLSEKYKDVFAADLSNSNLEYNKKNYKNLKNVTYHNIDMTKPVRTKLKFDAVLCVNAILISDYENRVSFIKNLFSILKPKGHLILVVPSLESALYSEFILDLCNRKDGVETKRKAEMSDSEEYIRFKQGVVNIEKTPTKHYLKEELITTLTESGFKFLKIDKAEYTWDTEMESPPKSLKDPYPWDWVVLAAKK